MTTFSELGLPSPVLRAIEALEYVVPTPIQARSIPLLLAGRDLIGSAQTGTGKTAAFALPVLTQLQGLERDPRALILVPTRELACQVEESIRALARFTALRCTVVYGGVGYGKQLTSLRCGTDILVATPGRLLDLVGRHAVDLSRVGYLVLDEADRMLDMGFLPDVRRIIGYLPAARQTALFSATIPSQIEHLIQWAMKSPVTVEIGERRCPAETVRHALYPVAQDQKSELLQELLLRSKCRSTIVFCSTKHRADKIGRLLSRGDQPVAVIHSNRSQRERDEALGGFRSGHFKVLVATDIAARGLDVPEVSHVINYDVPLHPQDYVHRIGRTGRALAEGDAFTIMVAEESAQVRAIERFIGQRITQQKLENFNYQYTSLFEASTSARQPQNYGKARGGRIHGGYFFARPKR